MAQAYTSNRFAALAASAPSKQPPPRATKDKATVATQKAQVAQELKAKTVDDQKRQDQRGPGNAGRVNKQNNRGPRPEGERRENRGPRPEGERRERPDGERRAPRKFDRRPGTGRPVNEEKKGSHGKGNWGSNTDAVAAIEQVEGTEPTTEQPTEEEAPKEEEPVTLTLAEFEKLKADNLVQIDRKPTRVVEEDETLKNKYVKVEKKHEVFVPGKGNKKNKDNKDKSAPKKQVIPIDQILDVKRNEDSGRRGGRGGKNQGGRGGNRNQNQQFKLDDSSFPALG